MVYLIILVFILLYIGFRGNSVLTTLYAISLNASTMEVGIIIGLAAFFPMLFAVYAGRISDRIGFRIPLLFGSFGVSLAFILPFCFQGHLYVLWISQTLFGLAFIFLLVNVQNLVGSISTLENRSQNYAIYSLGVSTAGLIGPSAAGFAIDHFGFNITYLIFSLMAAIPGIIILFNIFQLPPFEQKEKPDNNGLSDLLKPSQLRKAYTTSAIILTGIGIFEFYFPIFGNYLGLSASVIGLILSVNASAFFIVRALMPRLTKYFGEESVLIGSMVLASVSFVFIPVFQSITGLILTSFFLGLGLGCGQPLSIVMAYNASPQGRTGEVLGIRLTVNKIVQFTVPILFGSIGSMVGYFPVFWSNSLFLLSGGAYISYCKMKQAVQNPDG